MTSLTSSINLIEYIKSQLDTCSYKTTEEYSIGRDSLYVTEHQAFLDAIAGKRTPESPAQESIRSMQIVEATLQSWKRNARINLSVD